jgi:hypothetical protein
VEEAAQVAAEETARLDAEKAVAQGALSWRRLY